MADNGLRVGEDFVLQLNTHVSAPASVTWTTVNCVDSITINFNRTQVEMACRGEARVGSKVAKLRMPITIECMYSSTDSTLKAIRDDAIAGTKMHIRIVEAPTGTPVSTNEYIEDEFYAAGQSLPLGLEDGAKFSLELFPAADVDDNVPEGAGVLGQWNAIA